MKVLHVATRHIPGGAHRNTTHWMEWQVDQGFEVHLAVGAEHVLTGLPSSINPHVIPDLVRNVSPTREPKAFFALRRLIAEHRFDIIHTHQSKAGVLGRVAARKTVPFVVHSIHGSTFGAGYGRSETRAYIAIERMCANMTTAFVVVGDDLRRQFVDSGVASDDRFWTIHSPIDINAFAAIRKLSVGERRSIRRTRFGFDADRPLVVSIGRLEPGKRHRLLIERLGPLVKQGRIDVAIAGSGVEEGTLRRTIDELDLGDHVRLLGHVDAESVLAIADVLVHTSAAEGLAQVLVQAAAAGVPAVATKVEGASEVPGVRVVDQGANELASAVAAVLNDASRNHVALEAVMSWHPDEVARQIAVFHEDLLARSIKN